VDLPAVNVNVIATFPVEGTRAPQERNRTPAATSLAGSDPEREFARMSELIWRKVHRREEDTSASPAASPAASPEEDTSASPAAGKAFGHDGTDLAVAPADNAADSTASEEKGSASESSVTGQRVSEASKKALTPHKQVPTNNRLNGYCDGGDDVCALEEQIAQASFAEGEQLVRMRGVAVSCASIIVTALFALPMAVGS